MKLDLNWINLLILFGAIQGLIFTIVLIFNRKHPGAAFLSFFMLALAYNGFETFTWSSGLSNHLVFFELFPFVIILTIGPSLYLYTRSLLRADQPITKREIFGHYSIAVVEFVLRTSILIFHILWISKVIEPTLTPSAIDGWYVMISEPITLIVFLIYLTLSILEYRRSRAVKPEPRQEKERALLHRWTALLLICCSLIGLAWTLTVVSPFIFNFNSDVHYYPIEIGLVFFIYWIAFAGYHRSKTILPPVSKPLQTFSEADVKQCLSLLKEAMEVQKLYLKPELNLNMVSGQIGKSVKLISAALNQHQGESFNDFINGYRIREVQQRLISRENDHLTISGIALECGFNSQATFQRAFRNVAGMSPREYTSAVLKKVS